MKKKLLLAAGLMLFCGSALWAESESVDNGMPRHEFSASWGWAPMCALGESFANTTTDMLNVAVHTVVINAPRVQVGGKKTFGVVNFDYGFHVTSWLTLGMNLSFNEIHGDVVMRESSVETGGSYKSRQTNFCVMPTVKFNWLRKKYVGMYSRFSIGVNFQHRTVEDNTNAIKSNVVTDYDSTTRWGDEAGNYKRFAFQASFWGIEVGPKNIRAFTELGIGHAGIFQIGLRGRL